jgi:5-deoxy-glucuronate isomerase
MNFYASPRAPAARFTMSHPKNAGWTYVGFGLYRLQAGEVATERPLDNEVILVMVEGKAAISAGGIDYGRWAADGCV